MKPSPTSATNIATSAAITLLVGLLAIVAGVLAWVWIGGWEWAITGLLTTLVTLPIAAWLNAPKAD